MSGKERVTVVCGTVRRSTTFHATDEELLELARNHPAREEEGDEKYIVETWKKPVSVAARRIMFELMVDEKTGGVIGDVAEKIYAAQTVLQNLDYAIEDGLDILPLISEARKQLDEKEREYDFQFRDKILTQKIGPLGSLKRREYTVGKLLELAPPLIAKGLSNFAIAQKLEVKIVARVRTLRELIATLQKMDELPLQESKRQRQRD